MEAGMKRFLAGVAFALIAQGAAVAAVPPIMPVYAAWATAQGVTIRVPPLGPERCAPVRGIVTVALDKGEGGATLLLAWRLAGKCSPGPAAELSWTWQELGLKPGDAVRIANPLVSEP
jgi:hypothetical protein